MRIRFRSYPIWRQLQPVEDEDVLRWNGVPKEGLSRKLRYRRVSEWSDGLAENITRVRIDVSHHLRRGASEHDRRLQGRKAQACPGLERRRSPVTVRSNWSHRNGDSRGRE